MTDVSEQGAVFGDEPDVAEVTPVETPPVNPELAAKIAEIRAQLDLIDAEAARLIQEDLDRCAALDAAKARCTAACGPISDALAASTDPREIEALKLYEEETHAAHAADLELAYLVFSGQRKEDSNPAPVGETFVEAHVVVDSQ